eukprot:TRINITY_DN247_c0_g1_i1.p1 TRINITY_DN247_c0_g1~~TRINITY_DN247_c0_g1_i1.p1  ORF type:complete len:235 (-),score=58.38 TRINITY_DN247_c0_g1_i1:366-1070(-)
MSKNNSDDNNNVLNVVSVFFDKVEMLDIFGPLECFDISKRYTNFYLENIKNEELKYSDVNMLSFGTKKEIRGGVYGPKIVVDKVINDDELPENIDILIIPGGRGVRESMYDDEFLDWLKSACEASRIVFTICTGSILLAKTGLLNGRNATSNKINFEWVKESTEDFSVNWIEKARWVEDGKYITSSGVSAGIDACLHIFNNEYSLNYAKYVAKAMEYRWDSNQDSSDDPFCDCQ